MTDLVAHMTFVVAEFDLDDLAEGQCFTFSEQLTAQAVDKFAELSGDVSPLHMDAEFAQSRGFERRVVHGALLGGLVSRLVGVHCPGRNALLQSMNLRFHNPAYAGDTVAVRGVVDQISVATSTVVLKVMIENSANGTILAQGKAHVGFTSGIGVHIEAP